MSSATAAPRNRRLESGAGRWTEQHLMPCLFGEFLDLIEQPHEMEVENTSVKPCARYPPAGVRIRTSIDGAASS